MQENNLKIIHHVDFKNHFATLSFCPSYYFLFIFHLFLLLLLYVSLIFILKVLLPVL